MARRVLVLSEFCIKDIDHKEIRGKVIANELLEEPLYDNNPLVS